MASPTNRLVQIARGEPPAYLTLVNTRIFNVFMGRIEPGFWVNLEFIQGLFMLGIDRVFHKGGLMTEAGNYHLNPGIPELRLTNQGMLNALYFKIIT